MMNRWKNLELLSPTFNYHQFSKLFFFFLLLFFLVKSTKQNKSQKIFFHFNSLTKNLSLSLSLSLGFMIVNPRAKLLLLGDSDMVALTSSRQYAKDTDKNSRIRISWVHHHTHTSTYTYTYETKRFFFKLHSPPNRMLLWPHSSPFPLFSLSNLISFTHFHSSLLFQKKTDRDLGEIEQP